MLEIDLETISEIPSVDDKINDPILNANQGSLTLPNNQIEEVIVPKQLKRKNQRYSISKNDRGQINLNFNIKEQINVLKNK